MPSLLSIGEFSRATSLTVKTLRFYHEKSILIPARVEVGTGYRYYSVDQIEQARRVSMLRDLQFSINEIAEIVAGVSDDAELLTYLESKQSDIEVRMKRDRRTMKSIRSLVTDIRETRELMTTTSSNFTIQSVDSMLVATHRMQAPYNQCGEGFKKIGKAFGRYINGKPMLLCNDEEYREIANYDVCFPIKKGESKRDIEVRQLPAIRCVTLVHHGPYETLSESYAKMLEHMKQQDLETTGPTREVYIKGPGMIFKGNPKKYVTEIQFPLVD